MFRASIGFFWSTSLLAKKNLISTHQPSKKKKKKKKGSAPRPRPRPSSPSGPPRSPRGPCLKPARSEGEQLLLPPSESSPAPSARPSRASRSRSAASLRSRRWRPCGRRCRGRRTGPGRRGWRGTSWMGARGGRCFTSSESSSGKGAEETKRRRGFLRRRFLRRRRRLQRQELHLPLLPLPLLLLRLSSSSRVTKPRRSSRRTPPRPGPRSRRAARTETGAARTGGDLLPRLRLRAAVAPGR